MYVRLILAFIISLILVLIGMPELIDYLKKISFNHTVSEYSLKEYKEKGGNDVFRGSGNYSSDEAKEFARLKKELKDTQDTLEILKKAIGILGK